MVPFTSNVDPGVVVPIPTFDSLYIFSPLIPQLLKILSLPDASFNVPFNFKSPLILVLPFTNNLFVISALVSPMVTELFLYKSTEVPPYDSVCKTPNNSI